MPKIIDVICQKGYFDTSRHFFVVIDQPVEKKYWRDGDLFTCEDDGFFDFLRYTRGSRDAFGGAKFDIQMVDGTVEHASGSHWSVGGPKEIQANLVGVGVATLEQLGKCYVFAGYQISADKLNAWLKENTPHDDYDRYNEPRKEYLRKRSLEKYLAMRAIRANSRRKNAARDRCGYKRRQK